MGKQKDENGGEEEEKGGEGELPKVKKIEETEEGIEVSLDPGWVGVGEEWIEKLERRQVIWAQEKDRCLELVMEDIESGGTGEKWAEVLGRLDAQQEFLEEEMVEVTRGERLRVGLKALEAVAEEEMFLQTKIIGLEQVRREMEMWVPTMKKEVGALLEKMAIREVREEEVDRWEREGELVQKGGVHKKGR